LTRPTRVFLCDDNPELRELTRAWFQDDPDLVVAGEAGDAAAAIDAVAASPPDVLLLDLSMPRMDGLEAIIRMREVAPETAIVVFSGFSARRLGAESLRRGADRYVEKGAPMEAVKQAIVESHAARAEGADG